MGTVFFHYKFPNPKYGIMGTQVEAHQLNTQGSVPWLRVACRRVASPTILVIGWQMGESPWPHQPRPLPGPSSPASFWREQEKAPEPLVNRP